MPHIRPDGPFAHYGLAAAAKLEEIKTRFAV
jgi:hypothetical protein